MSNRKLEELQKLEKEVDREVSQWNEIDDRCKEFEDDDNINIDIPLNVFRGTSRLMEGTVEFLETVTKEDVILVDTMINIKDKASSLLELLEQLDTGGPWDEEAEMLDDDIANMILNIIKAMVKFEDPKLLTHIESAIPILELFSVELEEETKKDLERIRKMDVES
ncbi:MAG: hypothetical protein GPJ51_01835 [Candidatus Heimdallarchaeota archaeon]|nr:hypothetical protein [Candidatus Heimdallarchaeota archaeon]